MTQSLEPTLLDWLTGADERPLPMLRDGVWVLKSWKDLQHPPHQEAQSALPLGLFVLMLVLAFLLPLMGRTAQVNTQIEMEEIAVLTERLNPGDIISASDITTKQVRAGFVNGNTLRDAEELVGMEVYRPVRAGHPVHTGMVRVPPAVRRNSQVELMFVAPGMTLSGMGEALQDAASGEAIRVRNVDSGKTLTGVARADGKVVVR